MCRLLRFVRDRIAVPDRARRGRTEWIDRRRLPVGVTARGQTGNRHLDEIRIAQKLCPIGKRAAHCLDLQVERGRRPGAHPLQIVPLENVEHREHRNSTR